ncbi:MAG TPA: hypothetical protein VEK12_09895 [Alphaproteobacteria bacterium]|nr:hypothetical protein [Alphaproteobacteria bacterium]
MLRRILGIIGRTLIVAAVLILAYEVYRALERGSYTVVTANEVWSRFSPDSLFVMPARHPKLWENFLEPLVRVPLWLLLLLPGLLLEYLHYVRHTRLRPPGS